MGSRVQGSTWSLQLFDNITLGITFPFFVITLTAVFKKMFFLKKHFKEYERYVLVL